MLKKMIILAGIATLGQSCGIKKNSDSATKAANDEMCAQVITYVQETCSFGSHYDAEGSLVVHFQPVEVIRTYQASNSCLHNKTLISTEVKYGTQELGEAEGRWVDAKCEVKRMTSAPDIGI